MSNNTHSENNPLLEAVQEFINLDDRGLSYWRDYQKTMFDAFICSPLADDQELRVNFKAAYEEQLRFFENIEEYTPPHLLKTA